MNFTGTRADQVGTYFTTPEMPPVIAVLQQSDDQVSHRQLHVKTAHLLTRSKPLNV